MREFYPCHAHDAKEAWLKTTCFQRVSASMENAAKESRHLRLEAEDDHTSKWRCQFANKKCPNEHWFGRRSKIIISKSVIQ